MVYYKDIQKTSMLAVTPALLTIICTIIIVLPILDLFNEAMGYIVAIPLLALFSPVIAIIIPHLYPFELKKKQLRKMNAIKSDVNQ